MKDRLQMLMREANVSSNKLAELIGVQPSSISHILSGRNNPSYDFINKLVTNFPRVNVRWLLTGEGSSGLGDAHAYAAKSWNTANDEVNHRVEPKSTPPNENIEQVAKPAQTSIFFDDNHHVANIDVDSWPQELPSVEHRAHADNPSCSHSEKKRIDRVIIFYADGSFSEYSNNA